MSVINYIVGLGTSVMMPIIFLFLGIIFGVKIGKSFKAALYVGIGFEGLNLVINLLLDNLGPVVTSMTNNLGVKLEVLDAGWPVASTVGWGSPIMVIGFISLLVVNFIMLVFKLTNTVDIDIFNYWLYLCIDAIIYAVTGSVAISIGIMVVLFAICLKVADLTAGKVSKEFGCEGISFPHVSALPWIVFTMAVDWFFEKIPFLRKIEVNPEKITKKFGVLGESTVIGFILGAAIGLLAKCDIGNILALAVKVSAAMVLLPRMVGILLEGLNVIKDAVELKLKQKFPNRKFYIGMDVAILAANPSVIATGLLMIPITLLLAIVLPYNKVLPFVDLSSLLFLFTVGAAYCKKDILRMLVAGIFMMAFALFAATNLADVYSQAAVSSHATFPAGMDIMSSLNVPFVNPVGWVSIKIAQLFA
ncbi:PTS galactitol transporter subunit IIC [Clostridium sp. SHJSY1]|uniref:PTS galactitol transporter subunit IIC n=1 Tax=Clostridium sp. SHJSY1 TaxID=2942483 RepID=UPI002874639E|nr:PTS transporter subunit IIC [Clostridium sp. SHJSY1]MDS0525814.1 PTS galactitol transporter subunit IIC [Clostridium sp. SHJSY1]